MTKRLKSLISILVLVLILAGAGYYFIKIEKVVNLDDVKEWVHKDNESGGMKQEYTEEDMNRMLTFTNFDDNLSDDLWLQYSDTFEYYKNMILENSGVFNVNAWLSLGRAKKYVQDYVGAEEIYFYIIKFNPDNYVPEGNLADLYANYMNDYERAVEHYWRAINKAKNNYVVKLSHYSTLVDIYVERLSDRMDEFEKLMLADLENYKDNADFYSVVAKYYTKIDSKDEAIKYLEQALALDPTNASISEEIGRLRQ